MEAEFKRDIKDGKEFDVFLPPAKGVKGGETVLIHGTATLDDTIVLINKIISETKKDTANLAPVLLENNLKDTIENDWNFVFWFIQYKKDDDFCEQIRRPAASWKDRKTGVDCDCYSVFLSTLLDNQGINHVLRIAKYLDPDTGKPKDSFSHIYIVVPKNGNVNQVDPIKNRNNYFVLDCVPSQFDWEAPGLIERIDIPRTVNKSMLNGLGITPLRETTITPVADFQFNTEGQVAPANDLITPGPILTTENLDDTAASKNAGSGSSQGATQKPLDKSCGLGWLVAGLAGAALGFGIAHIASSGKKDKKAKKKKSKV